MVEMESHIPIGRGGVADQIPGLLDWHAGGMGDHQMHRLAAIGPEPHATKAPALPAAQLQPAYLTTERCCGAVDLGVTTQSHDVAPAWFASEPGDQLITGKDAIRQERDRLESGQEPTGHLQQSDRD